MAALTVYKNEQKQTSLSLRVRALLKEIELYCAEVDEARNYFRSRIKEIGTGNNMSAEDTFKIVEVNANFFEIWHYRPDGAQDWLMGSVGRTIFN